MSEIDTDSTADPALAGMTIYLPHVGIDLKRIMLSLKFELPRRKIVFGNKFDLVTDVVIPTLCERFTTKPVRNYLVVIKRKKLKIPMELEDGALSEKAIDILCRVLEECEINTVKSLPFSRL